MKLKNLITVFAACSITSIAAADQCATKLTGPFVSAQATKLCSTFQSSVNANTGSDTIATFGYSPSGTYVPLIDMRTRQLLTGFSGDEPGRGAIRLYDTIHDPVRTTELGYYEYGFGLFTDAEVFEIWAQDVSIRQLTGSTPAILELRDISDSKNLAFRNDGTVGQIYTSGFTWPDGAISMRPLANETFLFNGRTGAGKGNITQNASYGGSLVLTNAKTHVAQPAVDSLTATGTSITDALQLTKVYNNITTVAAGTGVKLYEPSDANSTPTTITGVAQCVRNAGANNLVLYPPTTSDAINDGTAGHGVSLTAANDQIGCCTKIATNKWWCTVDNSATVL
jgi:hypothetical protein